MLQKLIRIGDVGLLQALAPGNLLRGLVGNKGIDRIVCFGGFRV